ncbi:MAG: translation initiation factor IF-3 [Lentisphaeria bacterium]|nr:translation initiation factor IF-3 [Lentisphaeria bacterium]MBQ7393938.1 translation initiation factor IF-3 [Lentisphaeria bacterium]MBR2643626.1 translation initiation factor IF-3 [Lentisphaeria bacterium]
MLKPGDRSFTADRVRLIGAGGEQLDVVSLYRAREIAQEAGLDLVLVSDRSNPPVVRIMDFGKLQYEQKKNLKLQRKNNAAAQKSKEIKFHIHVDTNDYELKIKHALDFLGKGYKLKVTIQLRGREMAYPQLAYELMEKIMAEINPHGEPDTLKPKLVGRTIMVGYSPK